jgi:hypothetical protein
MNLKRIERNNINSSAHVLISLLWACSLAWIGRQSPKLQIAGSNPARSASSLILIETIITINFKV